MIKKIILSACVLISLVFAESAWGEEIQNPVKQEMIALRAAFAALVDAPLFL